MKGRAARRWPTDRRGIIAGGIEMQASVVSLEGIREDGDADQRGKQGEHGGAEMRARRLVRCYELG